MFKTPPTRAGLCGSEVPLLKRQVTRSTRSTGWERGSTPPQPPAAPLRGRPYAAARPKPATRAPKGQTGADVGWFDARDWLGGGDG